ncbi:hypothetical protein WICPIJ_006919 [Wickerhamomyces pijperi]|uniref:Uncharacterized protein n=1 Tax=Wickerhamomyces pijperi TaxID=599730 RepID=A0A9P8TKY5_WICPI|nr:hypothetical protein WICPIJ_006919 [Wickerhamomyces pijperi]
MSSIFKENYTPQEKPGKSSTQTGTAQAGNTIKCETSKCYKLSSTFTSNSVSKNKLQRHSISHFDRLSLKDTNKQLNSQKIRRNSFLSRSMMTQESHIVYNVSTYGNSWASRYCEEPTVNPRYLPTFMLALKESQGYAWNQDLFASRYVQETGVVYDSDDFANNAESRITRAEEYDDYSQDSEEEEEDDQYQSDVDDDDDVDMDMDFTSADNFSRRRRRSSAYSYSQTHEDGGPRAKVKVINIVLTDEEANNGPFT